MHSPVRQYIEDLLLHPSLGFAPIADTPSRGASLEAENARLRARIAEL